MQPLKVHLFNSSDENEKNPYKQKLSRPFLRKSQSKEKHFAQRSNPRSALRQQISNVPLISIDISSGSKRDLSKEMLERCRNELSEQKKILIKTIEEKEEKMEKLRNTFRNIQRSKSKQASVQSNKISAQSLKFENSSKLTMGETHRKKDLQQEKASLNLNIPSKRTSLFSCPDNWPI